MNSNVRIAAAVAAILGTAAGAHSALAATVPTVAQAASAAVTLNIAGSSAAKNAVLGALQVNLCGGSANALTFSSGNTNTNFFAVSCQPAAGVAGANGTDFSTVYYRDEGGSVSGALPIVNGVNINQLDLTNTADITCGSVNACTPTVTGVSTGNGTTDTFGGAVTKKIVQLGIMDVEPAALTGANYPSAYSTAVWGPSNPAGLQNLTAAQLFDEVYGIFVNENSTAFTESPLFLSKETVAQIFTH